MQKCETDDIDSSETLREFCIDFLEVNPIFFRSGYFKENILGKLKKIDHTQNEIKRLQAILIDAVLHRGQREYKKYCRLASVVADYAFIKDLTELTWHEDPAVKSRATLMLNLVKQSS